MSKTIHDQLFTLHNRKNKNVFNFWFKVPETKMIKHDTSAFLRTCLCFKDINGNFSTFLECLWGTSCFSWDFVRRNSRGNISFSEVPRSFGTFLRWFLFRNFEKSVCLSQQDEKITFMHQGVRKNIWRPFISFCIEWTEQGWLLLYLKFGSFWEAIVAQLSF